MEQPPGGPEGKPEGAGGPGWINPTVQTKIAWRDGDVVISVPMKSGTTWTMNIVHQLREKGDRGFEEIYDECQVDRDHEDTGIDGRGNGESY